MNVENFKLKKTFEKKSKSLKLKEKSHKPHITKICVT